MLMLVRPVGLANIRLQRQSCRNQAVCASVFIIVRELKGAFEYSLI